MAIWDDDEFPFGDEEAGAIVAAARYASPNSAHDERNNAPFADSRWVFSLNGFAFAGDRGDRLRATLSPTRRSRLEGDSDSEVLFGLALDRLDDDDDAADALRAVTATVAPDDHVRLNLLLTDGVDFAATTWGNSLFVRATPETVTVASEPLDDAPAWQPVPDRSIVSGSLRSGVEVLPLPDSSADPPLEGS